MTKQRLDTLLVNLNLCNSRALAQRYIRAGEVTVDDRLIDKPGTEVDVNAVITVKQKPPYVSRGGEKLAEALKTFKIDVRGRICLDGGISTGGFTDCLLQAGAERVYGVDVGYGQVAWSLRTCDRVTLKERTNFRYLTPEKLYGDRPRADLGVMDLSFISLTKVLTNLRNLLVFPHEVVLLVKPQFEVGKDKVGKKGVIRNPQHRAEAIERVWQAASELEWQYRGLIRSPIKGPAGNIEYLLWLQSSPPEQLVSAKQIEKIITELAVDF